MYLALMVKPTLLAALNGPVGSMLNQQTMLYKKKKSFFNFFFFFIKEAMKNTDYKSFLHLNFLTRHASRQYEVQL